MKKINLAVLIIMLLFTLNACTVSGGGSGTTTGENGALEIPSGEDTSGGIPNGTTGDENTSGGISDVTSGGDDTTYPFQSFFDPVLDNPEVYMGLMGSGGRYINEDKGMKWLLCFTSAPNYPDYINDPEACPPVEGTMTLVNTSDAVVEGYLFAVVGVNGHVPRAVSGSVLYEIEQPTPDAEYETVTSGESVYVTINPGEYITVAFSLEIPAEAMEDGVGHYLGCFWAAEDALPESKEDALYFFSGGFSDLVG